MAERDFLYVGCERGHDWVSIGGCNASCHEKCACSVPVHKCSRCGDCDYGDNDEAQQVRRDCAAMHGDPAERFEEPPDHPAEETEWNDELMQAKHRIPGIMLWRS